MILLVGCLGWLVCRSQARADDGNNLGIVVGPDAPRLEQFAADQLGDYLGKLFGLELKVNFATPYVARSPSEFWSRWNITLSRWFGDYGYLPLGGSRVPLRHQILNY